MLREGDVNHVGNNHLTGHKSQVTLRKIEMLCTHISSIKYRCKLTNPIPR